jgi:hypothetical protein
MLKLNVYFPWRSLLFSFLIFRNDPLLDSTFVSSLVFRAEAEEGILAELI